MRGKKCGAKNCKTLSEDEMISHQKTQKLSQKLQSFQGDKLQIPKNMAVGQRNGQLRVVIEKAQQEMKKMVK